MAPKDQRPHDPTAEERDERFAMPLPKGVSTEDAIRALLKVDTDDEPANDERD